MQNLTSNITTNSPTFSPISINPTSAQNIFITVESPNNRVIDIELAALVSIIGVAVAGVFCLAYRHLSNTDHRVFMDEKSRSSLDQGPVEVLGETNQHLNNINREPESAV
jgi:hypothetical protein